jgi:phytoene dehydrogenase-like protein
MPQHEFDIIVIGAGSGGLSVGLFMNKAGFKVLMISTSDEDIGGD